MSAPVPETTKPDLNESSFVRAMRVLRERWMVVVLVTALCTFIALAYSARQQKQYDATSHLLFRTADLTGPIFGSPLNTESSDPARDSFTNIRLVTSNDVAALAGKKLKSRLTPEQLIAKITVAEEENADVAAVTARDPNPVFAAKLANAFADSYVEYRRDAARRTIRESERALFRRLDSIPRNNNNGERRRLLTTLQQITSVEALQTGGVQVVDHAVVPSQAAVPRPKRNGVLGFLFGLVLGVSLAFLLDLLDSRIKRTEDFEDAYGLRVITTVPQRAFEAKSEADRVAAFEPYRILRGALDFRMLADDLKTLLVTGPSGEEGKTTVAVNLARAVAIAGQRVVLVEADLRRPGLGRHFALPPGTPGLTSVLSGQVGVGAALRQSGAAGLENLYILPSGPLPGNAPELLESRAMHDLLIELATFADLVVLDAPPLLPVSDARILLDHPAVDATIIVSRANKTTRLEARRVRAVLDAHDREPLGLVVCGVKGSLGDVVPHTTNGSGPRSRIRPVARLASAREPAKTTNSA
jgi:capsular exopolysaccharide synthesis family protein